MAGESAREVAARARAQAARLVRRAEMFERGAEGEARTASVLQRLPDGWTTMHDIGWPGRRFANIDHIVLGPGGIFVIDSKNWSGKVTLDGSTIRQNGHRRDFAVAACADSALAVSELCGSYAAAVVPVLCLVREEHVNAWVGDVMVCSTANLSGLLLTRPRVLSQEDVTTATLALDAQLRSAIVCASSPGRSAARPSRGRRTVAPSAKLQPRDRRGGRSSARPHGLSLSRLIVAAAMLLGFLAVGPQLATAVGEIVADQVATPSGGSPSCAPADTARHRPKHAEKRTVKQSQKRSTAKARETEPAC